MTEAVHNRWLHRYAVLTALATLALVGLGGLVTSHGVGMAVPDWPTSYGYNMFLFPIGNWVGGIFYEHTHRLVATVVGLLVVGLTRWLGGSRSRLPLALVGLAEILAGGLALRVGPTWTGAGYFLAGIGGVVILGAVVWTRHEPARRPLPLLGWLAFAAVQIQGLLGGLRVVLFKDEIGIFHAALAQLFFVLLCAIALLTSRWWRAWADRTVEGAVDRWTNARAWKLPELAARFSQFSAKARLLATLLILAQLILGATMRHQHAGLAVPDFPLAYGKLWPAMDAASVTRYNEQRLEITALNSITAAQIGWHMAHRLLAVVIFAAVAFCAGSACRRVGARHPVSKLSLAWLGLIGAQVLLGAATVWSNKAADIATAHVLVGTLSLACGALLSLIAFVGIESEQRAVAHSPGVPEAVSSAPFAPGPRTAAELS